jgi:hypothetical protein
MSEFVQKAKAMNDIGARVLLKDDKHNGSDFTRLIAQQNLASVIQGKSNEREQLEAIHAVLHEWLTVLFGDGRLEPRLQKLEPVAQPLEGQNQDQAAAASTPSPPRSDESEPRS